MVHLEEYNLRLRSGEEGMLMQIDDVLSSMCSSSYAEGYKNREKAKLTRMFYHVDECTCMYVCMYL